MIRASPVGAVIVEEGVLVPAHLVEGGRLQRHGPRVHRIASGGGATGGIDIDPLQDCNTVG